MTCSICAASYDDILTGFLRDINSQGIQRQPREINYYKTVVIAIAHLARTNVNRPMWMYDMGIQYAHKVSRNTMDGILCSEHVRSASICATIANVGWLFGAYHYNTKSWTRSHPLIQHLFRMFPWTTVDRFPTESNTCDDLPLFVFDYSPLDKENLYYEFDSVYSTSSESDFSDQDDDLTWECDSEQFSDSE